MPSLWHCAAILFALNLPHALADVQVKGFAQTGSAPGKLTISGEQVMAWQDRVPQTHATLCTSSGVSWYSTCRCATR